MTIKTEVFDATHIRTYSDANKMIQSIDTGIEYVDAVDPIGEKRKYLETDTPIPVHGSEIALT